MAMLFFKIWKDPVWSKVISTSLIGIFLILWQKLGQESFKYVLEKLLGTLLVPVWAITVVVFALIVSVIKQISIKKKTIEPINNDSDIIAILDSWWPENEGQFPRDVAVNFQEL